MGDMAMRIRRLAAWVLGVAVGIGGLAAQPAVPEVRDLFDLEREYIRARGGRVMMDEARTVVVRGRFIQDDTVTTFQSYRRRPSLYRMDLKVGEATIREGFDGTTAWRVLPTPQGRQVQRLEGVDGLRLRREAEFESPLVNHREKEVRLQYGGTERIGEHTCHVVRVERRGFATEVWYLEVETLHEVEMHRVVEDQGAVITRFHDWRKVEGRPVAHRVETYQGDQLVNVTILDRVQWNIGVLSDLFRVPD